MAEQILEIVEGPGAGKQVPLDGPLEIGRDPDVGLTLDDDLVSRRHARLTPQAGGAVVEDPGSRNGTFVNGNQIHSPTLVTAGDQILVGVTVLELRTTAQVQAQPTAVRAKPPALATPARQPDYVSKDVASGRDRPHELDPLLDIYTKAKTKTAVLALFVLVVLVVLIFLATR